MTFGNQEYTKSYEDMLGVEMGGSGINISNRRFAYCENVYRDYEGDGNVIESVPGFRRLFSLGEKINAIYLQKTYSYGDFLLIHAGLKLFRVKLSEIDKKPKPVSVLDMKSERSCAYTFGEDIYICDGVQCAKIDGSGVVSLYFRDIMPYVPTVSLNGRPFERRNLFCDECFEEFRVESYLSYTKESDGLRFAVTSEAERTCAVIGFDEKLSGDIYIPHSHKFGNTTYRVTEIADNAFFGNKKITSVHIAEGAFKIGKFAFRQCSEILAVYLPDTLLTIDNAAFADCGKMEKIYFGKNLATLGINVFSTCISLKNVYYPLGEDDFLKIENHDSLKLATKHYYTKYDVIRVAFPINSDFSEVKSLTVGKSEHVFDIESCGDRSFAVMNLNGPWEIDGFTVKIFLGLRELLSDFGNGDGSEVSSKSAILGCLLSESFDGRIFLSGNSAVPNAIFYTGYDLEGKMCPSYFPDTNYFTDGKGRYNVVSLLSVRDSLTVFKEGDDGSGSIFYHTSQVTGDSEVPTVYPVKYVHSGVLALGKALNFLDDPVFPSKNGISALDRSDINYERSIATRSHNVNYSLLKEDLSNLSVCEWQGYLAVLSKGKIYLADSRCKTQGKEGFSEYEWFYLSGIGSYENSTRVYRYSAVSSPPYATKECCDEVVSEMVFSEGDPDGVMHYFTKEDGVKYEVYRTEEMSGGDFSPATILFSVGELLFFGTDTGVISVFNNDKRGVPPKRISDDPDFNAEEYKEAFGSVIHPDFYSFDNHAVRYAIKTPFDNCSIPHLTKSTVKHSLVMKCKSFPTSRIHVEVGTDVSGYSEVEEFPGGDLDFAEFDFFKVNLTGGEYHNFPISEKEKGWVEKQISVYTDGFRQPFGIYSITYRYTVKGNIKR